MRSLLCLMFSGLKVLSIRDCPSVTPEGLLSVLALPFLKHFDYYTRRRVPKSFVWGIAAQNPSLESINVSKTKWTTKEKKAFFDKHPRIKAIHNLVSDGWVSQLITRCGPIVVALD